MKDTSTMRTTILAPHKAFGPRTLAALQQTPSRSWKAPPVAGAGLSPSSVLTANHKVDLPQTALKLSRAAAPRLYSTSTALSDDASKGPSSTTTTASRRGLQSVQLLPSYLADARAVQTYSTEHPDGALQLGVAESPVMADWLVPALNLCPPLEEDCIYYQPTPGRPSLRATMANFLEGLLSLPQGRLDTEGLVVGAGCNAVLENLCLCLADAGEAVLIPTPYYAAFEFDLVARAGLHVQPLPTQEFAPTAGNPTPPGFVDPSVYYPTEASLDAAYEAALSAGHPPRILLLSHPHNPLGICYPVETVQECLEWCRRRQVHLVSDEIYAGSVYQADQAGFESILKVADQEGGLGPYVHFVYALSKDFALSGFRLGVAYTENQDIRLPLQKLNDLCQISSQTQVWTETLLKKRIEGDDSNSTDALWTTAFRTENHRRLRQRCEALTSCLDEYDIPYLPPTAGLFCWIDLTAFMSTTIEDAAARERELYLRLVNDYGLLLTPGWSMRNEEPGFFRMVFTAATDEEFALGLERLGKFATTAPRTSSL